jgi:hypothetical protein
VVRKPHTTSPRANDTHRTHLARNTPTALTARTAGRYESYARFRGVLLRHLAGAVDAGRGREPQASLDDATMAQIRRLRVLIIGCGACVRACALGACHWCVSCGRVRCGDIGAGGGGR